MNDLFEEVFVDEVYHSTHPNGYMSAPQEFWELVVTCLEVTEDIVVEPGTPASVGACGETFTPFFLLIYKVKAFGEVAELLARRSRLIFLSA
ncbi:hypothetical protein [Escherichia coli]|uniref:hypothetical protein n=1 Tax=Escherichia coli TaxID=562 RepID=UPI0039877D1C